MICLGLMSMESYSLLLLHIMMRMMTMDWLELMVLK